MEKTLTSASLTVSGEGLVSWTGGLSLEKNGIAAYPGHGVGLLLQGWFVQGGGGGGAGGGAVD